ncbi:MAG: hypothetical protein EON58_04085 [Alphaproteobacteria bacterium]|nr:MAG: hypothetical protein EON58_04085 [Alphaproteobacteria bacterium]
MYTEMIVGALVGALGWNAFVTPRLERRRQRALVDIDRIARLAGVAGGDIDFTVCSSYRVLGQSGWTPRYRVQFYYRDLSVLVGGQGNPNVDMGEPVEFDKDTAIPNLEQGIAERVIEYRQRSQTARTA